MARTRASKIDEGDFLVLEDTTRMKGEYVFRKGQIFLGGGYNECPSNHKRKCEFRDGCPGRFFVGANETAKWKLCPMTPNGTLFIEEYPQPPKEDPHPIPEHSRKLNLED